MICSRLQEKEAREWIKAAAFVLRSSPFYRSRQRDVARPCSVGPRISYAPMRLRTFAIKGRGPTEQVRATLAPFRAQRPNAVRPYFRAPPTAFCLVLTSSATTLR